MAIQNIYLVYRQNKVSKMALAKLPSQTAAYFLNTQLCHFSIETLSFYLEFQVFHLHRYVLQYLKLEGWLWANWQQLSHHY